MRKESYILIVENEKGKCAQLADFLRSLNYQVDVTANGQEALNMFLAANYEVEVAAGEVTYQFGDVKFDSVHQILGSMRLSSRESEILLLLCRNRGNLVDRNVILKNVWRDDSYFASRSLSVYINHLRNYLKEENCPVQIISIRGKGYKLIDQ